MRYLTVFLVNVLLFPTLLQANCLTRVRSSYHARENFAIVVLEFDRQVAYRVREGSSGTSVRVTLPECGIDPQVARALAAVSKRAGTLISSIQIDSSGLNRPSGVDDSVPSSLVIDVLFSGKTRLLLRESSRPFSLILDISPARKEGSAPLKEEVSKKSTAAAGKEEFAPLKSQTKSPPKSDPGKADSEIDWLETGRKAMTQNQLREAFNAFEKAAIQHPDSLEAHYRLGLILHQWGQLDSALDHLSRAEQDSRFLKPAAARCASIYRQQGRSEEEIAQWEKILTRLKEEGVLPAEPPADFTQSEDIPQGSGEISDKNDRADRKADPQRGISPIQYFLWASVVFLGAAMILSYRRQREFQRTIRALLDDGEQDTSPVGEAVEKSGASGDLALDVKNVIGSSPESGRRSSEETARQVFDLNSAGLSIHDIAEKLKLGQDEVRLILNLKREETVPA